MEFGPLGEKVLQIYLAQEKSKRGDQCLLSLSSEVIHQLRNPLALRNWMHFSIFR